MLELDRSFAEMKIENIVKSATSSSQAKHTSNSSMDNQHEEVKEPTGPLLRKHLPESQIIGDPKDKIQTRNSFKHTTLLFEIDPKHIDDAMSDEYPVKAMQEELDQFQKNNVWKLVELPKGKSAIRVKWVFRNKLDKIGNVVRNQARLVAKGYSQQEDIDYTETFA